MFDSITIFDWDGPSFGVGKRGRKLLRRGEEATATIVGIKVTNTGSDDSGSNSRHYAYALDVKSGISGPVRMGCRQNLTPARRLLHIGSQVIVKHRKGRVIIDWTKTLDGLGVDHGGRADCPEWWKPLKGRKIPPAGVEDKEQNGNRRRIAGATPARATILRVNDLSSGVLGMGLQNVDVDVQLTFADGKSRQALLRRIVAPDYAYFLLKVGTVLPVGVDKGGERITVDWVAAANGDISTDSAPPQATRNPDEPLPPTATDKLGGIFGSLVGKALDSGGMGTEAPEGAEIPFQTYVEISARLARDAVPPEQHDAYAQRHGVAPGAWGPGSRAWQSRCARDWKLGAQYGQAYQDAYSRLG
jgi:hypothetical protein